MEVFLSGFSQKKYRKISLFLYNLSIIFSIPICNISALSWMGIVGGQKNSETYLHMVMKKGGNP